MGGNYFTSTKRAKLLYPSLRLPLAAPGWCPVLVYGNAIALGTAAVEVCAVLRDVGVGPSTHKPHEFRLGQGLERAALATRAHLDPAHHGAVELESHIGCGSLGGHVGARA